MIDTIDLTSYYPGYDDYCEPKVDDDNDDFFDDYESKKLEELKIDEIKSSSNTVNEGELWNNQITMQ